MLGLIGEVGEVVTELKKYAQEGAAYLAFPDRLAEELGDVLWYAADLAERRGIRLADLGQVCIAEAAPATGQGGRWIGAALSLTEQVGCMSQHYDALLAGRQAERAFDTALCESLARVLTDLGVLTQIHGLSLVDVAAGNLQKVNHGWARPLGSSPLSEGVWPQSEQLPACFDAWLSDQGGCVTMSFSVGDGRMQITPDSLTDNAYDPDGYRFHDVFHLAYAAVLDWSPVTRSLLQRKRKSNPQVDEVEDGGSCRRHRRGHLSDGIRPRGPAPHVPRRAHGGLLRTSDDTRYDRASGSECAHRGRVAGRDPSGIRRLEMRPRGRWRLRPCRASCGDGFSFAKPSRKSHTTAHLPFT